MSDKDLKQSVCFQILDLDVDSLIWVTFHLEESSYTWLLQAVGNQRLEIIPVALQVTGLKTFLDRDFRITLTLAAQTQF